MVNETVMDGRSAERALAISYAPAAARPALAALLALDGRLGAILRATREPLVGQMRLTWWHDALHALDRAPPPAEPVLLALSAEVLPCGVSGATLAAMVDGWEALLAEPLDAAWIRRFAEARGGTLFRAGAAVLGVDTIGRGAADAAIAGAGEGWALADLAGNLADAGMASQARTLASERLAAAFAHRWSRATRPLGALALLARADLAGTPPGSPRRVARLLRHRLTGR